MAAGVARANLFPLAVARNTPKIIGMTPSTFRFLPMVLLAVLTLQSPLKADERPPNVVLVLVDDLGWMDLACFGSKYYETPHLDRLAAEGMKFEDGYAACAVCSPTRAAVMTGRYPARTGVTDWIRARFQGGKIPEDKKPPSGYVGNGEVKCPKNALWLNSEEITLAEQLKKAGYVSCHIGKWHLGADDWYPEKQGFDFNHGGCDYGQPPSFFDPYTNARLKQGIPNLKPRKEGEYLSDREGDEAVGFIKAHKDKPFFLFLANYAVHTPIQAKVDVTAKYEAKDKGNQKSAKYAAMVESVDDAVGKVLTTLKSEGIEDNTIVIFTSDNGGLSSFTNNAPLRSGKGNPYEGGIRVPVIIKWPGVTKPGSVSNVPITSVDYFPTVSAAAGLKIDADLAIDGLDLRPLLSGEGELDDRSLFWHFPHYRGRIVPYSIVRKGDFKLLKRYAGDKKFELYNLADDISETKDLADSMPEKVEELNKLIEEWCERTSAKMPIPNK